MAREVITDKITYRKDITDNIRYSVPEDKPNEISVKVDVSEALTCLKALQREAREATKALRELEEAQKRSQTAPWMPGYGWTTTSNWSKSGGTSINSVRQDGDDE